MIDVNVSISGIIMCCDESLCGIALGRGYAIEKCDLDTLFFKDKITNGRGNLNTDYFGTRIIEDEKISFICLKKDDIIQIEGPSFSASKLVISDKDCMCEDELAQYMDKEMEYLNERINLLRLFKSGNIGIIDVFFYYSFTVMGFNKYTVDHCSHNQTRNTIASQRFTLNESEVVSCNQWLNDYCDAPYALLKNIPTEVQHIHQKVLDFYRFRSESLHEGNGSNITDSELHELENITREVLKKCLWRCKTANNSNFNVTWEAIKDVIINDLIAQVTLLKNSGVLPA